MNTELIKTYYDGIADQYTLIAKDIEKRGQDSKELTIQRLKTIEIRTRLLAQEILKEYDNWS